MPTSPCLALAPALRDQGTGERCPSRLMGGTEALSGLAVEVFVEEDVVAPRGIALEELGLAIHRTPPLRVEQEEPKQPTFEFVRDLAEVRLCAGTCGQLDGEALAEGAVQVAERLERKKIEGEPDRTPPV